MSLDPDVYTAIEPALTSWARECAA
jgi:hypothetical protein